MTKHTHKPLKDFLHQDAIDSFAYSMQAPIKKKNPTKTFIGGVACTLAVIYIIFPFADYMTDTLLAYLMK